MYGQKLKVVNEFTYLGVNLVSTETWQRQKEKYKSERHTNIKNK